MDERLKHAFNTVINKHHAAVQTDTQLEFTDKWQLEKKAKLFWEQYHEVEAAFLTLLERCTINDEKNS
jgi:hypothetical protein